MKLITMKIPIQRINVDHKRMLEFIRTTRFNFTHFCI